MNKRILCLVFFLYISNAFGSAKIMFSKGDSNLLRNEETLKVTKGMKVFNGDVIVTGESGLVIIKSKASTYKVSKNSHLKLDLRVKEIINSNIIYGSVVVEFMKKNLKKSKGKTLKITTRSASFGVRGTKFFTYVDAKNKNSVLSVEHGKVAFQGTRSKKERLVGKNKSSMTNVNNKDLKQRKFGFEKNINWNLSDEKGSLKHKKGLFIALSKTWNKYKNEKAIKWKKNTDDMNNLWNNVNKNKMGN